MHLEFSRQIFEKYSYQILWKSVQCEPNCSKRAGGRADTTKSLFEILRTRLRTPWSAFEDDVTILQRAVRHSCRCFGQYSNSVAYLCFSLILCSVFRTLSRAARLPKCFHVMFRVLIRLNSVMFSTNCRGRRLFSVSALLCSVLVSLYSSLYNCSCLYHFLYKKNGGPDGHIEYWFSFTTESRERYPGDGFCITSFYVDRV